MTDAQIHELQLSLNHWQGQAVNNQTTANIYKAKSDDLVVKLKIANAKLHNAQLTVKQLRASNGVISKYKSNSFYIWIAKSFYN